MPCGFEQTDGLVLGGWHCLRTLPWAFGQTDGPAQGGRDWPLYVPCGFEWTEGLVRGGWHCPRTGPCTGSPNLHEPRRAGFGRRMLRFRVDGTEPPALRALRVRVDRRSYLGPIAQSRLSYALCLAGSSGPFRGGRDDPRSLPCRFRQMEGLVRGR